MTTSISSRPLRHTAFDRLPGLPKLFRTYCTDYPAVAEYYAGDFHRQEARAAAAQRAARYERDRDVLADVLAEQNERWGSDAITRDNIEALRQNEAVAVVTGQQVGLFTGPLYTPLKTLTTLQLARRLAEETGRPVVPVFWLEGEDHDFEEVAGVNLLRRNRLVQKRYEMNAGDGQNRGPVGRLVFSDDIEQVVDWLDDTLPPSDFKPDLMASVREAYRPGTTLLDAFARLMRSLFEGAGLVFVDPSDPRLKAQAAPLFRREIENPSAPAERLRRASGALEEEFHAQVRTRPTNLFLLDEAGRLPIDARDGRFELRGTGSSLTQQELLDVVRETPERLSPNVVLRPLMQDMLLPTALYVAGPGEVSYFAQYRELYEWTGVPMPIIYPRASATLVESKVQKVLDKYELALPDLAGDLEQLFQRLVKQEMDVDVDVVFQEANRGIHKAINQLKPQLEAVDATLGQSTEATRAVIANELGELKKRVVKAEKRTRDEVYAQLEKAHINLFPGGKLQERVVNVLYFLNKYSPDLIGQLEETLSLDTTAHQVVTL